MHAALDWEWYNFAPIVARKVQTKSSNSSWDFGLGIQMQVEDMPFFPPYIESEPSCHRMPAG